MVTSGGPTAVVRSGEVQGDRLRAGDYLYTPPNGRHAASTAAGCLLLVTLPKPIQLLKD
jgi:quercetin dioxygenase-like cupin family protein